MERRKNLSRAVLLDRDGTIINERGYLSDPRKLKFYSFSFLALRRLQKKGFKLVVVTNQSGIGRGYFSEGTLKRIHLKLKKKCEERGVKIDRIYYCPDKPGLKSTCRKPSPTMALKAARDLHLDLSQSYIVGDQDRDLQMAFRVKAKAVLVLTGAGRQFQKKYKRRVAKVTSNLLTAANWIIQDAHGI